jgi:thiol-disulfide isomerase/thioredoxin
MDELKLRLIFILILVISLSVCKSVKKNNLQSAGEQTGAADAGQAINFREQSTWLLGFIDPVQLGRSPYSEWYLKGYDGYQADTTLTGKISAVLTPDLSITVVLGTWCPDSHREVPRFMKIMKEIGFPPASMTFIGVDIDKRSPVGEFEKLDIQRVPTFIFYKKNIEKGRIIENPTTSLEQDMLNILTGKN